MIKKIKLTNFQSHPSTELELHPGYNVIFGETDQGKAQPVDEVVLTPTGWRCIGDLSVGDLVVAGDGSPTPVIGVFPQGRRLIYNVQFSDQTSARCDLEHLWTVSTDLRVSRGSTWQVKPLSDLVGSGLTRPGDGRRRWRVPVVAPLESDEVSLPVGPYLLGALLGDGCLSANKGTPSFTQQDQDFEVVRRVSQALPADVRLIRQESPGRTPQYTLAHCKGRQNPLTQHLRDLNLYGCLAADKHIPDKYLSGSVQQRLALLQGLMDTDGWVECGGAQAHLATSSVRLAEGVTRLVRSLGGTARTRSRMPTYRYGNVLRVGQQSYNVLIVLPAEFAPFSLTRKADAYKRLKAPQRKLLSVEPVGESEAVCIAVAHQSQTYVTKDYVVTHNTAILRALTWVMTNRPLKNKFMTRGAKECRVEIETDKGTIVRERKKGFNGYIVNGQEFKDIGTTVPVEVSHVLDLHEVNLQSQLSPFFLITQSPGQTARYISELLGFDLVDSTLSDCRAKVAAATSKINQTNDELETVQTSLKKLAHVPDCVKMMDQADQLDEQAGNLIDELTALGMLVSSISSSQELLAKHSGEQERLDALVGSVTTELAHAALYEESLEGIKFEYAQLTGHVATLVLLKPKTERHVELGSVLNAAITTLDQLLDRISSLAEEHKSAGSVISQLVQATNTLTDMQRSSDELESKLTTSKLEYANKIKELGVCPYCMSEIDQKVISQISEGL